MPVQSHLTWALNIATLPLGRFRSSFPNCGRSQAKNPKSTLPVLSQHICHSNQQSSQTSPTHRHSNPTFSNRHHFNHQHACSELYCAACPPRLGERSNDRNSHCAVHCCLHHPHGNHRIREDSKRTRAACSCCFFRARVR